jgi:hypothetical protein
MKLTHTSHEVNVNGSLYKQKVKFERRTMMKKFLVLALVLGMAGLAGAGLLISVNGQDAGPEITITPSTWITLDIMLDPTTNVMGYDLGARMAGPGSTDTGNVQIAGFGKTWLLAPAIVSNTAAEFRWTAGDIPMFGGTGQTGGKILDQLLFHCDGKGDVTITLWSYLTTVNGVDFGNVALDTLTIHQIPEPITMVLLGLGGLFLRKR